MNPIEVELPDGTIVEFPAGTPRETMQRALQGLARKSQPPAPSAVSPASATAPQTGPKSILGDTGVTIGATGAGVNEGLAKVFDLPRNIASAAVRYSPQFARQFPLSAPFMANAEAASPGFGKDVDKRAGEWADWTNRNIDLRNSFDMAGVPVGDSKTMETKYGVNMTPTRRILNTAGDLAGQSVPMIAAPAMSAAQLGTKPAQSLAGQMFTAPYQAAPAAAATRDTLATVGAGVGAGLAKEADSSMWSEAAGALAGGMLPGLLSSGFRGATGAATNLAGGLKRNVMPGGSVDDAALAALREATGDPRALALKTPPLADKGARYTLGQLSGNKGAMDAEIALRGRFPGFDEAYKSVGNAARQSMDDLAGGLPVRPASEALADSVTKYRGAAKKIEDAAWKQFRAADVVPETGMPTLYERTPLARGLAAELSALTEAERAALKGTGISDQIGVLNKIINADRVSLTELQGVRAELSALKGPMEKPATQRLAGKFVKVIDDYMDNLPVTNPQALDQYKYARAATAAKKQGIESTELGKFLAKNPDGTPKIPPSEAGAAMLRMPAEAIERMTRLSPTLQERARAALAAHWKESTVSAKGEESFHKAASFFKNNEDHFKALMSPQDFRRSKEILGAFATRESVGSGTRFGSPTYEKFMKGSFLEKAVMKGLKLVPGAGLVARGLEGSGQAALKEQLDAKIAELLLNPQSTIVKLLAMKATPGNAQLAIPTIAKQAPELLPLFLSIIAAGRSTTDTRQ